MPSLVLIGAVYVCFIYTKHLHVTLWVDSNDFGPVSINIHYSYWNDIILLISRFTKLFITWGLI